MSAVSNRGLATIFPLPSASKAEISRSINAAQPAPALARVRAYEPGDSPLIPAAGKLTPSEPSPEALMPSVLTVAVFVKDPDPITEPTLSLMPVNPNFTPIFLLKSSFASTIRASISTCFTGLSSSDISFLTSSILCLMSWMSKVLVLESTVTLPLSDRSLFSSVCTSVIETFPNIDGWTSGPTALTDLSKSAMSSARA